MRYLFGFVIALALVAGGGPVFSPDESGPPEVGIVQSEVVKVGAVQFDGVVLAEVGVTAEVGEVVKVPIPGEIEVVGDAPDVKQKVVSRYVPEPFEMRWRSPMDLERSPVPSSKKEGRSNPA